MKFCEAMERLKNGSKVTRQLWADGIYFLMQDKCVKSFQPKLSHFAYNEDIMVSEGWIVEDNKDEFSFCDIIPYLRKGYKAKLKDWKESFIYLDPNTKSLVIHSMDCFPFTPEFESFLAEDWIEV